MVLGLGLRIGLTLGLAEDWVSSMTAEIWSQQSFVRAGYSKTRPDTRQDSRRKMGRSSKQKPPEIWKMWRTDRPTDLPTDMARCRVACPQLKTKDVRICLNIAPSSLSYVSFYFCERKLHFVNKPGWMHGYPSCMRVGGSVTEVTEAFWQERWMYKRQKMKKRGQTDMAWSRVT